MSKSTTEIRQTFLDYFHSKGHQVVASSSLVPTDDPTLLFTNAGMNQFKDLFLGLEKRDYSRATTSQRCVRAGGKHNDLENVGYTARHHTFFEMLGNFSFGDYFKQKAIHFTWELLTDRQWFNLPAEKLWITVYESDDEAYDIWANQIGVPASRIIRIGDNKGAPYASDNFWQMGDTGPCGPCSEVFYDHGEQIWGGPPGSLEEDGDRYIEIWNIVFMQFNREADGTMTPLPRPSVDTGMGLERIAAVLQGVHSNYEIDLFQSLIQAAATVLQTSDLQSKSLRVLADHIRACAFLIADGVIPANEGRGYVLRRIIRRAVRHGHILGAEESFFYRLVAPLIEVMGSAAAELQKQQQRVEQILKTEEEQFARTLERGLQILDEELSKLSGDFLDGEILFRLYDTYGFPFDLTADICREKNIRVDEEGFATAMEQQRQRAREASQFVADYTNLIRSNDISSFCGYQQHEAAATVIALYHNGQPVTELNSGEEGVIILDQTPFYAESGGQIGDSGQLVTQNSQFTVQDTQKYGQAIGHIGRVTQGVLRIDQQMDARIDIERRGRIRLNHSATHLLHAALREELGEHVAQKGSLVSDSYLRFDFSHHEAVTAMQLRQIEDRINQQIRGNSPIMTQVMSLEKAKASGAMALFGEKYDAQVRVLTIGNFSTELCGGTHAERTGDIGLFCIIAESGVAAGVRRIEAVTGEGALAFVHQQRDLLSNSARLVRSDSNSLYDKIEGLLGRNKVLEKENQQLKDQQVAGKSALLANGAKEIKGIKLVVSQLSEVEPKILRTMVDNLKNQLECAVIVLATVHDGKVSLITGVTKQLTERIKAGELAGFIAQQIGGKGGGRPDMAQAGGTDVTGLPKVLTSVEAWIAAKL